MDLKEVARIFIEAVVAEVSGYELVIKGLQDRVTKLEDAGVAVPQGSPPSVVIEKPQPIERPLTPQTSITSAVKAHHLKFAVAIVKMLLKNQKEGKSPQTISTMLVDKFPTERVKLRATITILNELIEDQLVEAISIKKKQNQYNVPESRVSTAREWVQANSAVGTSTDSSVVVKPPKEAELAILDESRDGGFVMRLPNGSTRFSKNRTRTLKSEATKMGFKWRWATEELAKKYEKKVEVLYKYPAYR